MTLPHLVLHGHGPHFTDCAAGTAVKVFEWPGVLPLLRLAAGQADHAPMEDGGLIPEEERLRHALGWLATQRPCTLAAVEEAGRRFGLSVIEAATLYRWFAPHADRVE